MRERQETNGVRQIRSRGRQGIVTKCYVKGAAHTVGKGWLRCHCQVLFERMTPANVPKEILEQRYEKSGSSHVFLSMKLWG